MNFIERMLIIICRLYPLKSGCGTIANSQAFLWIEGGGQQDSWVDIVGGQAYVPTQDYVGRSMKYFGDLDPKVSDIVDKVVRQGDTCIDVGANLGLVSLRMAERAGPNGLIHAFEPQPQMIEYLMATLSRRTTQNIALHQIGLGRERGTLTLSVPSGNAGRATMMASESPTDDTFEVDVIPLTEFMETQERGNVALVKIDVEGFESEVIAGGAGFFETSPPWVVLLEEHAPVDGPTLPRALELLVSLNYEIFAIPKTLFSTKLEPIGGAAKAHDYVAVSKEAPNHIRKALSIG